LPALSISAFFVFKKEKGQEKERRRSNAQQPSPCASLVTSLGFCGTAWKAQSFSLSSWEGGILTSFYFFYFASDPSARPSLENLKCVFVFMIFSIEVSEMVLGFKFRAFKLGVLGFYIDGFGAKYFWIHNL
jgi:hypothetical protein